MVLRVLTGLSPDAFGASSVSPSLLLRALWEFGLCPSSWPPGSVTTCVC